MAERERQLRLTWRRTYEGAPNDYTALVEDDPNSVIRVYKRADQSEPEHAWYWTVGKRVVLPKGGFTQDLDKGFAADSMAACKAAERAWFGDADPA